MPPLPIDVRYRYHVANLEAVGLALAQNARVVKHAIRRQDDAATLAITRMHALLAAAEMECRLLKLMHESVVLGSDRAAVLAERSQRDQWLAAIDRGFRRRYGVGAPRDLEANLEFTPRQRRDALRDSIDADLQPLIQLRNVLAHGQWRYAFTTDHDALNEDTMRCLSQENFRAIEHRRELLSATAHVVRDLYVSGPTFARDFDSHYAEIEKRRRQLRREDYAGYVAFLRKRHARRPGASRGPSD